MKRLLFCLILATCARGQDILAPILFPPASASTPYTGMLDIRGSNILACYSLQACSSALRGTKAVNICNVSDVVCADLFTDATTGKLVVTNIGGSDCTMVTCTIKIWYDQTGGNTCSSASCDIANATIANRPTFYPVCPVLSGSPCAGWVGSQLLQEPNGQGANQILSASAVAVRTANFTSFGTITGADTGIIQLAYNSATNQVLVYSGSITPVTAADSTIHALEGTWNGSSSSLNVDGTPNAGLAAGANGFGGTHMCVGACNNATTGYSFEIGWWTGDQSATDVTMSTNQHSRFGF